MLNNGRFEMTRGDRQRLPSWDETQFIQLDTHDSTEKDVTNVPDLTNRTVDLSLVTQSRNGDRIALTNPVEIGDETNGEVAITLEESDTAVPIDGSKTNLYGEFRISGGTNDPTTAGVIKIELSPSRHDVEGEAALLPHVDSFSGWAVDGVMDAAGASIQNVDDFGGTSATVDSVNTGGLNSDRSFRLGRTVYYNPANPGPYIDGSDAFADVPPGGTFIVAAGADYDVATEGRLVMADGGGKTIRGEGWTTDPNQNVSGSKIVNSGADVVDSPVIEFSSAEREERGISVHDLGIVHEGATSPAIHLDNTIRNTIADCKIDMGLAGQTGIETSGKSYFTRIYRTNVSRFTDYGIHLKESTGGGDSVIDCHVGSASTGAVATRVERQGNRISGGQHSADGAGISFYNPDDVATRRGSIVDGHIWFEACDDAIRVDGNTQSYNNVIIINPRTTLDPAGAGVNNLVNLGRANDVTVLYPTIFRANDGGNLATLSANTYRPKFIGDYGSVGVPPIVDNGANLPTKFIYDSLNDSYLANVDTAIPTWVALRRASAGGWSPAFHDGSGWYEQSSANSPFVP